ncbi:MAG: hypothetical protein Q7T49_01800 [bacterium]|nr:hypothetical protein [bacterium]
MDARSDLLWLIGIIGLLFVAWFYTGGPNRPAATGGPFIKPPAGSHIGDTYGDLNNGDLNKKTTLGKNQNQTPNAYTPTSPISGFKSQITLERGNAAGEDNPNEEYVVIKNNGSAPVIISGWSLKNGGDERLYQQPNGSYLVGRARWAVIPNGLMVFNTISRQLGAITLLPKERAVINTGRVPSVIPIPIDYSFKSSICTGYLDSLLGYVFSPGLKQNCPAPAKEPGSENLSDECYKIVSRLSSCHTPKFEITRDGITLMDGKKDIPTQCQTFIKEHFNYNGCLKYHAGDSNFFGSEWRIFLKTTELWAKDREAINLYDAAGQLVDRLTY